MKKILIIISALICIVFLSQNFIKESLKSNEFSYEPLERLPVLKAGRTMPLSSAANDAMRILLGKTTVKAPEKMTSTEYFILLNAGDENALKADIFKTDNRDLQKLLGINSRYYNIEILEKNITKIEDIANSKDKSPYTKSCVEALNKYYSYKLIKDMFAYSSGAELKSDFRNRWKTSVDIAKQELLNADKENRRADEKLLVEATKLLNELRERSSIEEYYNDSLIRISFKDNRAYTANEELLDREVDKNLDVSFALMAKLLDDIKLKNFESAREVEAELISNTNQNFRIIFENFSNKLDAFYGGAFMYIVAFLSFLLAIAFPKKAQYFNAVAIVFFSFALLSSTFALIARSYIQMRPPVTNLYSSIVFSGWASTVLALIYYIVKKRVLYVLAGSLVGFICLIIAINMPYSGDTMAMMRAVLNSNFWLTSHVVTIMLCYCAIFFAGSIAIMRLIIIAVSRGNTSAKETKEAAKSVYGILSLGFIFAFLGTMLGGIWADMSWGRFWGWDPKENGALIIVLYLAVCLHARIIRLIGDRAFLALAIFGNIVTAWAWFGVNMLGIGLHSYGFFNEKWTYFIAFVISQLAIMLLAFCKEKEI